MRKYACKDNVSCLRQVYASCSDVVNLTFCAYRYSILNDITATLFDDNLLGIKIYNFNLTFGDLGVLQFPNCNHQNSEQYGTQRLHL